MLVEGPLETISQELLMIKMNLKSALFIFTPFPIISMLNFTITKLTHWGRMTLTCVSKVNVIGSDNGLSPVRRQAINDGILLNGPLGTNFDEINRNSYLSLKKMHLKIPSGKCRPFCLGVNVLLVIRYSIIYLIWFPQRRHMGVISII